LDIPLVDNLPTTRPVCLITGGSSGIGLATAQLFAGHGYDLSICGRRETKLAEAKDLIQSADSSAQCLTTPADLNDVQQARNVAENTIKTFGRVDVLVNNAASSPLAPFEEISGEVFESAINTNIRSLFYLTQIVWANMKQQGRGVVVNISSLSAVDPFPGFSLYGACKAWLDLLTHALAAEGKEAGLRVCSVRPGAVETPMLRGLFPDFPPGQCVQPADVANVVWQSVNDAEMYPSGQAFPVTNQ
jgi:NAD(P)-dependent dehydrogenase (short-subunit alcohol dehydrogenase family)